MSDILKESNKLLNNNEWTNNKESLLRKWMNECNLYGKLYSYNVIRYEKLDSMLGIFAILLSTITGTSLLNQSSSLDDSNSTRNILIIMGSLSVLNTFIQGSKEYLNLKTSINSNLIASRQNRMIALEINTQLTLNRQERKPGKDFLINIKNKRNDLILNGPVISDKIWNKLIPSLGTPLSMTNIVTGGDGINNGILKHNTVYADSSINIKDIENNKDYDEHKFYQNLNTNNTNRKKSMSHDIITISRNDNKNTKSRNNIDTETINNVNTHTDIDSNSDNDNENKNEILITNNEITYNKYTPKNTVSNNNNNNNDDNNNDNNNDNNKEQITPEHNVIKTNSVLRRTLSNISYGSSHNTHTSGNISYSPKITKDDIVMDNINVLESITPKKLPLPKTLSQIHINNVNKNNITDDILYIMNDELSDSSNNMSDSNEYNNNNTIKYNNTSNLIYSNNVSDDDDNDFISDLVADDEASNQILRQVKKMRKTDFKKK